MTKFKMTSIQKESSKQPNGPRVVRLLEEVVSTRIYLKIKMQINDSCAAAVR